MVTATTAPRAAAERHIRLLIPRDDALVSSFWVEVIAGAEAEAQTLGFRLAIDVLGLDRNPDDLDGSVSGLILAGRRSRGVIEPYLSLPIPKVLIGHPRPMELVDSVQSANFDAGYAVGDMLGRLGHRRIAFFTDAPEDEGRNLRQAGLAEAMRVHGGTVVVNRFDPAAGGRAMALAALSGPEPATALTGATDFVAITLTWGAVRARPARAAARLGDRLQRFAHRLARRAGS